MELRDTWLCFRDAIQNFHDIVIRLHSPVSKMRKRSELGASSPENVSEAGLGAARFLGFSNLYEKVVS